MSSTVDVRQTQVKSTRVKEIKCSLQDDKEELSCSKQRVASRMSLGSKSIAAPSLHLPGSAAPISKTCVCAMTMLAKVFTSLSNEPGETHQ